eukprot:jgi/Hompol1/6343/HPOL_000882-RA
MEGSIRRVVFDSRQPPSAVVVSELADAAYGCHIWPSALVLSKLISDGSSSGSGSDCVRVAGCRVIELGAGVGLVGLAAAVVGGASVTVLTDSGDHPHILRNLATSLSLNSTGSHHIQIPPQMHVSAASWADFETLRRLIATHGPFDVILGADVLYEPAAFEDLVATVAFLLRNASPAAVFYTSYQERSARRQASLSASLPDKPERTTVQLEIGEEGNTSTFTLCSLIPGHHETQALDLYLTAGEEIALTCTGNCTVDLIGNHVAIAEEHDHDHDDEDLDDEEIDDEDIDDEDEDGLMDLVEGEDDEDDEEGDEDDDEEGDDDEEDDDEEDEDEDEEDDEEIDEEELLKALGKRKIGGVDGKTGLKKAKIVELPDDAEETKPKKHEEKKKPEHHQEKKPEQHQEKKKPEQHQDKKAAPAKHTLPSGVVVEDTTVGEGAVATKGSKVSVRYIGRLTNGKTFDSNTKGAPFTFKLGSGNVIPGWDVGVAGMKVGGSRTLTIPPAQAYGKRGAPPDIPPHSTL